MSHTLLFLHLLELFEQTETHTFGGGIYVVHPSPFARACVSYTGCAFFFFHVHFSYRYVRARFFIFVLRVRFHFTFCSCVLRCFFLRVCFAVTKLIDSNKLPHLLFYGPPGTGKTSTILACARKLYGPEFKMMVLEVKYGVLLAASYLCCNTDRTRGTPTQTRAKIRKVVLSRTRA